MGKKISNKEVRRRMKMNELVEAEHWLIEHRQTIIAVVAVIAVVAAGYYFYGNYRQKKIVNSLNQYNQALRTAGAEQTEEALLFAKEVIESYPSTPAYEMALILKGDLLYDQQDWQGALEAYEKVTRSRKPGMAPAGLMGVAVCQENLGNRDQAEETYRQIINRFPKSGFENRARVHLAMLLERDGRIEEAVTFFEAVPEDSPWHEQAARRLEWLKTPVVTLESGVAAGSPGEEVIGSGS